MRIAITGAYGLVGSNLIEAIPKYFSNFFVTRVKCDDLSELKGQYDIIIHAAGYGQPLKFTVDKIKTIEINTKTTIELFKYLKSGGKFLFVSTSEVYSGTKSPYVESILGTTTPDHPRACYIEGKRCGEAICHAYREQGFDVKIARLALAYGPGTKKSDTRVLNQFIEQGLTGEIKLRDQGEALRTYIYVQDAVDLMWKILLNGKDVVYNIGGFSTLTIKELAEEIGYLCEAIVTVPEKSDRTLQGAPELVTLDMTKTLKEFNQSFVSLRNGLKKTINYQKKLYGKI